MDAAYQRNSVNIIKEANSSLATKRMTSRKSISIDISSEKNNDYEANEQNKMA
ncbi:hypothetical protein ECARS42123_2929 [Escherichia coli ARS4.2123]|nr:hypothetical protein ECARS42123_2929 [Escherichia coli ARS4.2123]